jgi:hypothetical protein
MQEALARIAASLNVSKPLVGTTSTCLETLSCSAAPFLEMDLMLGALFGRSACLRAFGADETFCEPSMTGFSA